MQRTHLRPAITVDKNGKMTTVYRRNESATSSVFTIPSPTANPSPPSARTDVLLSVPEPLSKDQKNHLLGVLSEGPDRYGVSGSALVQGETELNLSLLYRMVTAKPELVKDFKRIACCARNVDISDNEMTNLLRVVERIADGNFISLSDDRYSYRLVETVIGLDQTNGGMMYRPDVFTTEKELAGNSALVAFIARHGEKHSNTALTKTLASRHSASYTMEFMQLRNAHLADLIKEQPEDLDAISEYVLDRGMHPSNKGPVSELQEYLKETISSKAVAQGWL